MEQYTYQQKIAVMRILLDIINADGIIDAREMFFFNKLKEQFDLIDDDYDVVNQKNSLLALIQVKELNAEQKKEVAKMMSDMIIVDEDINVNEVAIYNIVCEFCSINVQFDKNDKDE